MEATSEAAVPVYTVGGIETTKRPTVHALPRNLGRLAEHTAEAGGRFGGVSAVRVAFSGETYTAEATSGKALIRVTGPTVVKAEDFPLDSIPALASAPNGAASALVPAATWKKAFAGAKRLRKAAHGLGVVTGEKATTFGATDFAASTVETATNSEERFPPTDDILQTCKDADTAATFSVDAALLGELLKTVAELVGTGPRKSDIPRVTFHVPTTKGKPILLTATGEGGAEITAVVMPLAEPA